MTKAKSKPMDLWDAVAQTDPVYTKSFKGTGGFSGTAINNQYLNRRMTEIFGPCGSGWGYEIMDEQFVPGHTVRNGDGAELGVTVIHILRVQLWYLHDGGKRTVEHFGQTTFVGKNKHGMFTDEEAPKKSLTDALAKCMSMIGLGADVYLGMYDDHKYVESLTNNGTTGSKAKSRDSFDELTKSMRTCQTTTDMGKWYKANEKAILALPPDWTNHLREEYRTMHQELLTKEQAPMEEPEDQSDDPSACYQRDMELADSYAQGQMGQGS